RNALQAGDVAEAKRQAQAAVEILKQLAQAGESTYGFAGIINELQSIEQSADQRGIDEAQAKLEQAKKDAEPTKAALEELKKVKVAPTLSPEAEQALLAQLKKLAEQAGIILTIPVTAVMPKPGELDSAGYAYVPNNPEPPKFATGGILRGPGTGTSDSILARLSNGEGIINARAVRHYGPELVHAINRLRLPGFAEGGIASTRLLPSIPQMSPELRAAAAG